MKISFYTIFLLTFLTFFPLESRTITKGPFNSFNKVIIWGHKLHSHTHSYIHWGFDRAFKHLGYETYWFDNNDKVQNFDFSNSLFLTEGQVDQKIPLRDDSFYILHNCTSNKYQNLYKTGHAITLQVYTNDCNKKSLEELAPFILYDSANKTIYMPWATDLLPHEIDTIKGQLSSIERTKDAVFVGTRWTGKFGNDYELDQFKKACEENNITFKLTGGLSMERHIEAIESSYMAPALQGRWQCDHGYIPCRIFKNISYGQFGITNSETVYQLFEGKIVYNSDPYQLFFDAKKRLENLDLNDLYELMDFVRDNHTYINRINYLLTFMHMVYEQDDTTLRN